MYGAKRGWTALSCVNLRCESGKRPGRYRNFLQRCLDAFTPGPLAMAGDLVPPHRGARPKLMSPRRYELTRTCGFNRSDQITGPFHRGTLTKLFPWRHSFGSPFPRLRLKDKQKLLLCLGIVLVLLHKRWMPLWSAHFVYWNLSRHCERGIKKSSLPGKLKEMGITPTHFGFSV